MFYIQVVTRGEFEGYVQFAGGHLCKPLYAFGLDASLLLFHGQSKMKLKLCIRKLVAAGMRIL
jgi:hypothetical protein